MIQLCKLLKFVFSSTLDEDDTPDQKIHFISLDGTEMDGETRRTSNECVDSVDGLNEPQIEGVGSRKKFICKICSKSHKEKGAWKRHQLVHTGERKYECQVCNRRYKSQQMLK